jgi:tRNA A-37 threonylcarbamoyl transferase component Bud32
MASLVPAGYSSATLLTREPGGGVRTVAPLSLSAEFRARWTLGQLLGVGGMGCVYAAQDRELGRDVAIKFMLADDRPDATARFLREGKLTLAIEHPNVVRVHALGETEGHPYIVAELVAGGTLRQRLTRGPRLDVAEVVAIGAGLLDGLSACHARGVIHRDVKPDNVMLTERGQVKLTDLGIAHDTSATQLTQTGTVMGTALYMAPEQVRGEQAQPAWDIYSAAVVLYEMLAGKQPFAHEQMIVILQMIETQEPPPLIRARPDSPQALARAVHAGLAKKPARRPATALALRDEIRAAVAPPASRPVSAPSRPVSRAAPDSFTLYTFAVSAILVVVGFVYGGNPLPDGNRSSSLVAVYFASLAIALARIGGIALATLTARTTPVPFWFSMLAVLLGGAFSGGVLMQREGPGSAVWMCGIVVGLVDLVAMLLYLARGGAASRVDPCAGLYESGADQGDAIVRTIGLVFTCLVGLACGDLARPGT